MRVDTTGTETNIDYPTDSSLLADGVGVLTHTMKKITKIAGQVGINSAIGRGSLISVDRPRPT
jgi:hypothetical protein